VRNSIIILALSLPLLGCPPTSHPSASQPFVQELYFQGNPRELINGAQLQECMPKALVENVNKSYELVQMSVVRQSEPSENLQHRNARVAPDKKNKEPNPLTVYTAMSFSRVQTEAGQPSQYTFTGGVQNPSFSLIETDCGYEIDEAFSRRNGWTRLLHFSQNGKAFSILWEEMSNGVDQLIAYYFSEGDGSLLKAKPEFESPVFDYLRYGPIWEDTVQLDICGNFPKDELWGIQEGLSQWRKALRGRLNIKSSRRFIFPPFSDLNSHCVYHVSGLDMREAVAWTTHAVSLYRRQFVDSDITFFNRAIIMGDSERFNEAGPRKYYTHVALHEIGHFLGVDHQMDLSVRSIMRPFTLEDFELQPYDISSIEYLYGPPKMR
jgi:hypothetical protein